VISRKYIHLALTHNPEVALCQQRVPAHKTVTVIADHTQTCDDCLTALRDLRMSESKHNKAASWRIHTMVIGVMSHFQSTSYGEP